MQARSAVGFSFDACHVSMPAHTAVQCGWWVSLVFVLNMTCYADTISP